MECGHEVSNVPQLCVVIARRASGTLYVVLRHKEPLIDSYSHPGEWKSEGSLMSMQAQ